MWHIYRLKKAFDTVDHNILIRNVITVLSTTQMTWRHSAKFKHLQVFLMYCSLWFNAQRKKAKKLIIIIVRHVSILHSLSVYSGQDLIQSLLWNSCYNLWGIVSNWTFNSANYIFDLFLFFPPTSNKIINYIFTNTISKFLCADWLIFIIVKSTER